MGERDPLRGLTSPSFRKWVPRTTARLRSKGADLDALTTITLAGAPLEADLSQWDDEAIRIDLLRGGDAYRRLLVRDVDGGLKISYVKRADR
jgi:hypothetical protein